MLKSLPVPWRTRFIGLSAAVVVALVIFAVSPAWLAGIPRIVAAYDCAVAALLVSFWSLGIHADSERTKVRAAVEDPGRDIVLAVILLSVAAGLGSAVAILGSSPHTATPAEKGVVYALAIGAVAAGWLLIHTMFLFRYAHMYYYVDDDNDADRGLTFPGTKDPNDFDFAYFSFVIGMTFQVSDVEITDQKVRRVALYHALVSFAYSTMILALAINIVSGLLH
jgi:uncharacterized membrane protein